MTKKKAVKAKPKARKVLTQKEKDLNKLLKLSVIGCHDMRPLVRHLTASANDNRNQWTVIQGERRYRTIVYSVYFAILSYCSEKAVLDLAQSSVTNNYMEYMTPLIKAIFAYRAKYRIS